MILLKELLFPEEYSRKVMFYIHKGMFSLDSLGTPLLYR